MGAHLEFPLQHDDNIQWAKAFAAKVWRGLMGVTWVVQQLALILWAAIKAPLIAALQILAALIILFEEWGWKPLHDLLERLGRFGIFAAIEQWLASLPPYGALSAFVLPAAVLLPFKLLALFLLAGGHVVYAAFVFIAAKLVGTALLARIFMLTKPALMQIAWFATGYAKFVFWKDALFATIRASRIWRYGRMLKTRLRLEMGKRVVRWRPYLEQQFGVARDRALTAVRELRIWLTGS